MTKETKNMRNQGQEDVKSENGLEQAEKEPKVEMGEELKEDTNESEKEVREEDKQKEDQPEDVPEEEQGEVKEASKDKKRPKKDKKTQQIEELKDRLMRTMAEFDNFRKRSEKEKSQMFEIGAKSILEKMLPVIDNFERGLKTVTENDKENAFVQGMERTYKQFITTLEELEVRPIEALGKEFDPNIHNAVMHEEDESQEANMVVEELQKGYMYRDTVLRYSMVKVVN